MAVNTVLSPYIMYIEKTTSGCSDWAICFSAGQDCAMYLFSSDHDRHSKSMGKAVWNKKAQVKRSMPPFSQVCFLLIREFYLLEVMCSQEQIISANVVNKYFV